MSRAGAVLKVIAVALLAFTAYSGTGEAQVSGGTRSPHGNLAIPCQNCHTASGWTPIRAVPEFDHNRTRYPLRGMHQSVTCAQCHIKPVFSNVGQRCQDCHADIHKRQLGANCEACHTVRGWQVSIQQIQQHNNRFPLTGAHAAVDCDACHKGGATSQFQTMSTACGSCHFKDFQATTNPNHVTAKFSTDCNTCHSSDNWLNAKFDHSSTGFLLTGGHAVPPRQCTDCHTNNNYTLTTSACLTCHLKDFQATKNPNHVAANFPSNCLQCHTTAAWQPAKFDHSPVNFVLTGAHTVPPRQCTDCHVNNNYNLTSTTCVSCHLKDFQGATNPNHVSGGFAQTCETCHTTAAWQPASFDHAKSGFPLTGAHTVPPRQCTDCHVNNNFNITSTTCVSCHQNDFNNAVSPVAHAGFPTTCQQCHDTVQWTNAKFDHSTTGFTLSGAHTVPPRQCTDCHVNNNFNITATACVSCHQTDYNKATTPVPHSGFPTTCAQCHDTVAWTDGKFDHSTTGFVLSGAHTVPPRQCTDCHVNNNFNITATACVSCHQTDYNTATTPVPHSGFPTTCAQCHDTVAWTDGKFDHSTTGFVLTGAHTVPPRQCVDCHVNNNYNLTSTTCVSCHLKDFQGTTNPNHVSSGFAQTCEKCHNTAAWQPATFDHATSGFPLTGAHTVPPRQCTDCHVNNNYNITATACVSCHQTDYNTATTPVPHSGFPTTCQQCHDTVAWTNGKFDHSTTGFILAGAHTVPPRQCTDCHVNNNYNITATACVSCHQTDYNTATTPVPHSGFPTTCAQCHDTVAWTDGKFDHSTTGFVLTGAHTVPPRQCTDCHVNNNYNLTSTTCVSCHLKDFQGTTNPNHVSSNFPQTCQQCHSTTSWLNATFDHSTTGFPLSGAHTVPPRQCTDCHVNNNYNITATACVSCHQTDYNTATTPVPHAGFPTTCQQCHDMVAWTDGKFDHSTTGFVLTGAHTVPPRQCVDCHVNNNYNLTSTTCVSCHLKDFQGTTNPNHVSSNFPQTCQQCHSTTSWLNATFDHNTTGFALTGSHTVPPRQCTDCHVNNSYNITATACVSCHQTDYNTALSPVNHVTAHFPTTCASCHDTVLWTDGKFDHTSTGFTLTGAHTVPPRQCLDCHVNGNYNITATACVSCHQTDYNTATTPVNHVSAHFPTTCESCHDTVLWTNGKFDHASTGFTLTGAHTVPPRQCVDCHVNGNYSLNSTLCYSCHQKDYAGTNNPAHASAGFPTTCELCHNTTVWTDSTFNHANTTFPLTGSHTVPPRQCTDCHVNGNYTTLPITCIGCHQTDYSNTTNPGHKAQPQFFPTTCQTCHTTTAWTGATFNHTQYSPFPTSHGGANNVCATCHTNSNDYSVFQCTACHGGNNSANFQHDRVSGYVYNSINCYQCHRNGQGG
ncbi:MAG: multiheme c-type cytochrome [Candidatus Sulfotelmatobacter sp.]